MLQLRKSLSSGLVYIWFNEMRRQRPHLFVQRRARMLDLLLSALGPRVCRFCHISPCVSIRKGRPSLYIPLRATANRMGSDSSLDIGMQKRAFPGSSADSRQRLRTLGPDQVLLQHDRLASTSVLPRPRRSPRLARDVALGT